MVVSERSKWDGQAHLKSRRQKWTGVASKEIGKCRRARESSVNRHAMVVKDW
jgi:hypothetical protein